MHAEPLLASTRFYPCFTIPRARSPGFGSYPSNSGHFHTQVPHLAIADFLLSLWLLFGISLATQVHSLARYSKRTVELSPYLTIAIRFQALLTSGRGFFSTFPHSTLFAIGLKKYLRLEIDASHILIQYPMNDTQDTAQILLSCLYEAITLFGLPFQESLSSLKRIYMSSL